MAQLGVDMGDSLSVVRAPNGIELSVYHPTFDEQMKIAHDGMNIFRNALVKRLNKWRPRFSSMRYWHANSAGELHIERI